MYFICFINHNFPIPNVSSKRLYYSWIFKNFIQIHQINRSNCLLINCFFICFFISYFFYLSRLFLWKSLLSFFDFLHEVKVSSKLTMRYSVNFLEKRSCTGVLRPKEYKIDPKWGSSSLMKNPNLKFLWFFVWSYSKLRS